MLQWDARVPCLGVFSPGYSGRVPLEGKWSIPQCPGSSLRVSNVLLGAL